jgi:putative aldouronate transport system substrate-binding protein
MSTPSSAAGNGAVLPSYQAYTAVKPDLPGDNNGVMPAFLSYPTNPIQFASTPPGKGDTVTTMTSIDGGGVPPTLSGNSFWGALNDRLKLNLQINMTPNADYIAKLQATIAGNELPEIFNIRPITGMPDLLAAKGQDLTEFLAGDAIKDYPALANIPTVSWQSCIFNERLYAIPLNRSVLKYDPIVRQDLLDAQGVKTADVKDGPSFLDFCQAVTNPAKSQWATSFPGGTTLYLSQMYDVPNVWAQANGKFTKDYETDGFKEVLNTENQMWKKGYWHPDTFGTVNVAQLFGTGRIVFLNGGAATAYYQYAPLYKAGAPNFKIGYMAAPKWDGSGPAEFYFGPAIYSPVALRKQSADRIKYLLSIMNYLASPFGTQEYLFLNYGVKGTDYTMQGSDPIKTAQGVTELNLPIRYLAAAPLVIYAPGDPTSAKEYHSFQEQVVPRSVQSAALGLYSPTDLQKGPAIESAITSVRNDIIQGRKSVSDWDAAVKAWRSGGGNTIRSEYEEAFAKANG